MTVDEYRTQYKLPEDLRACFVTRKDWPHVIAWLLDNKLSWRSEAITEDALFQGDSDKGDAKFNCLFLGKDGMVRKWDDGARDAETIEAGILGQRRSTYGRYSGEGDLILSASLFRSKQTPPPELDF